MEDKWEQRDRDRYVKTRDEGARTADVLVIHSDERDEDERGNGAGTKRRQTASAATRGNKRESGVVGRS
jgi:hypothetical protein